MTTMLCTRESVYMLRSNVQVLEQLRFRVLDSKLHSSECPSCCPSCLRFKVHIQSPCISKVHDAAEIIHTVDLFDVASAGMQRAPEPITTEGMHYPRPKVSLLGICPAVRRQRDSFELIL